MPTMVQTGAAVLVGLLLVTAVTGWAARVLNGRDEHALESHAVPAEMNAVGLRVVYGQVHTAQTAFELTGAPRFAAASAAGFGRAVLLTAHASRLLSGDPQASTALAAAQAAATRWHNAARHAAHARRTGTASPNDILEAVHADGRLYAVTTRRLDTFLSRITYAAHRQLASVATRQTIADVVAWSALAAALLVAVAAVPVLRRRITRPLESVLRQVDAVSTGDTDQPIAIAGAPTELAGIAAASERMRTKLLRHARDLAAAQGQLAVRDERDRFAGDLHDHTVQEVFALSLALSSAASRSSEMAGLLDPLIEQTDRIIRQFRAIIFDVKEPVTNGPVSAQLQTVVASSTRALGFQPQLTMDPATIDSDLPPRVAADLIAVLRESLSNAARHAHATRVDVGISTDQEVLRLRVSDNGEGLPPEPAAIGQGLQSLRDRALRLGGTAQVTSTPGDGTTIVWQVGLSGIGVSAHPASKQVAQSTDDHGALIA